MKTKFLFIVLASLFLLASCQKREVQNIEPEKEYITVRFWTGNQNTKYHNEEYHLSVNDSFIGRVFYGENPKDCDSYSDSISFRMEVGKQYSVSRYTPYNDKTFTEKFIPSKSIASKCDTAIFYEVK